MPPRTEKRRKFIGAELQRKGEGKKTQTGISEQELEKMAASRSRREEERSGSASGLSGAPERARPALTTAARRRR